MTTRTLHETLPRGASTFRRQSAVRQQRTARPVVQPLVLRLLDGQRVAPAQALADVVTVLLALAMASMGAARAHVSLDTPYALYVYPPLAVLGLWLAASRTSALRTSVLDELRSVAFVVSGCAMAWTAIGAVIVPAQAPGAAGVRLWVYSLVFVTIGRAVVIWSRRAARATRALSRPVLIIGAGRIGVQIGERLRREPQHGLQPAGFLDVQADASLAAAGEPASRDDEELLASDAIAPLLGGTERLAAAAAETGARDVILAFPALHEQALAAFVRQCEQLGLTVLAVPRLFEWAPAGAASGHLGALPLGELPMFDPRSWRLAVKYGIDRVVAAFALLALAPVLGAVALAVKLSSPGPVLFRQRRIGRDGRVFDILKFRSMREDDGETEAFRPAPGCAPGGVETVDRRTAVGTWLRRTSLDELPQLLNVLRGDMSLIGPRPERPEFVEQFGCQIQRYGDRHRVKSGITGWAQVHGLRGQSSLVERVAFDNFYIQNWSLWLDVKTALLTVPAVLSMDAE